MLSLTLPDILYNILYISPRLGKSVFGNLHNGLFLLLGQWMQLHTCSFLSNHHSTTSISNSSKLLWYRYWYGYGNGYGYAVPNLSLVENTQKKPISQNCHFWYVGTCFNEMISIVVLSIWYLSTPQCKWGDKILCCFTCRGRKWRKNNRNVESSY